MSDEGPVSTEDTPEPASARGRWAAALVPLGVGVAAFVNSWALGLGTLTAPGAGLWPAGASAIMVAGSVVLLLTRPADGERFGPGVRTIGLALVVIGLYVLLFGGVSGGGPEGQGGGINIAWPGIGFEWATVAMLAFWLRFIGRESWRLTLVVAVAVTGTLHIIFIELLKSPIPHVIGG